MDELIQKLSEIRGIYNCLDEYDEPYYRALSDAIQIISEHSEKRTKTHASDLISRQAAIDAADRADYTGLSIEDVKKVTDEMVKEIKKLPPAQSEQTKMIKEIRERINSGNRGSADYFIVDQIEGIINKYE